MSEETQYYLVPASSGLCIQPGWNSTVTAAVKGNKGQLWSIEQSKKNKVSFRNADSGEYLRAAGGNKSNAVKLGRQQWWTLETSDTPHAFWVKCEDFPNAYLCNSYGNITPNNTIYMWAKEVGDIAYYSFTRMPWLTIESQEYWAQTMLWYLFDYNSWMHHRGSKPDLRILDPVLEQNGSRELEMKLKEAEEKTRELEKKLKAAEDIQRALEVEAKDRAEKQQEYESREKALADREQEFKGKERTESEIGTNFGDRAQTIQNGDDGVSLEKFKVLQGQFENLQKDMESAKTTKHILQTREADLMTLRQAYDKLQRNNENGHSQRNRSILGGSSIISRRLLPELKEKEAAMVGSRDRPPGFSLSARPGRASGRTPAITMQRDFTTLPRFIRD